MPSYVATHNKKAPTVFTIGAIYIAYITTLLYTLLYVLPYFMGRSTGFEPAASGATFQLSDRIIILIIYITRETILFYKFHV